MPPALRPGHLANPRPGHRSHRAHRARVVVAGLAGALVATMLPLTHVAVGATEVADTGTGNAEPPVPQAAQKPNILLVTTDDMAVTDLAYMPKTRRLLGGQGATFTDAISSYPLCCPARATILTGQLSHNHGVRTNEEPYGGWAALKSQPDKINNTIGVWLQQAGYHTMFTGKFLNGYGGRGDRQPPPGWDRWYATTSGGTYNYYDFGVNENGTVRRYADDYQTSRFGSFTRRHISESARMNKPFFIWESGLAPHDACYPRRNARCAWGPAMPAERDRSTFSDLRLKAAKEPSFNERVVREKPSHMRGLDAWRPSKVARATRKNRGRVQSLQAVDRSLAKTMSLLRDKGELANTLVIFTSDNGYMLGQHRWMGKILPYEPSLQVPLLMRWPAGDIPAGVTRAQTTALADLPSTIAEAAGATPLLVQDGRSLLPLARGDDGAEGYGAMSIESGQQGWTARDHRWFYRGVRTRRYTYLEYPRTGEVELYDRRRDPSQLNNVAYRPAYSRTRSSLADKLVLLKSCVGGQCLNVTGDAPAPLAEPYLTRRQTVHPDELGSIGRSRQVVTVVARSWRAGEGMATAWQRRGRTWTVRRGPFRVTLGARGLVKGRVREYGTGETPAGTFRPAFALGRLRDPGTPLPYRRFDRNDYWVVDRRMPSTYNTYQERRTRTSQWRTRAAERWWSHRGRYPHALMLDYNLPSRVRRTDGQVLADPPADVRRGSFAVHTGRRLPARGWASMPRTRLRWLLRWMRPERHDTRFVVGTPGYLRGRL